MLDDCDDEGRGGDGGGGGGGSWVLLSCCPMPTADELCNAGRDAVRVFLPRAVPVREVFAAGPFEFWRRARRTREKVRLD
jgi:hypothetical protein